MRMRNSLAEAWERKFFERAELFASLWVEKHKDWAYEIEWGRNARKCETFVPPMRCFNYEAMD
jgi:hypothetical protein